MHVFRKGAVVTAAAGLLALGAVAGSGGSALANQGPPQFISGCAVHITHPGAQTPNCAASDGTVVNPTVIGVVVDTSALGDLIAAVPGIALDTSWTLACVVNGSTVTAPGSYDISSVVQNDELDIDLQTAVGSPEPNSCTISDLTVTTSKPLYGHRAHELSPFTIGVDAAALVAVPGAVYQNEAGPGAHSKLCADDTANGNAGSKIQAYQCATDLAQVFVRTGVGQFVHNGDCLSLSGGKAVLAACAEGDTAQEWDQAVIGGPVKNAQTQTCLTAPSVQNGTQLTVASCGNGADQKWYLPAPSVYVPCGFRVAWNAGATRHAGVAMRAQC